jgi:hypothetical protein
MNAKPVLPASALAALLFMGCAHMYQARVYATNSPVSSPPASYRLKLINVPENEDSSQILADEDELKGALHAKGLSEAPKDSPGDLLVMVDYTLGPRRRHAESRGDLIPPSRDGDGRIRDNSAHLSYSTEQVTTYEKRLTLTAYENRPTRTSLNPLTVWRVEASIDDESPDLAKYTSALITATAGYINTTLPGTKKITVSAGGT